MCGSQDIDTVRVVLEKDVARGREKICVPLVVDVPTSMLQVRAEGA